MLSIINRVRQSYGRQPLAFNYRLINAAQMHAEQMVFNNYCSSLGRLQGFQRRKREAAAEGNCSSLGRLQGFQHLYQRILAAGYNGQFQYQLEDCSGRRTSSIVNSWMENTARRNQILDHRITHAGFGQLAPAQGLRAAVAVLANPR
jgi:uncharacterized protein YkwD